MTHLHRSLAAVAALLITVGATACSGDPVEDNAQAPSSGTSATSPSTSSTTASQAAGGSLGPLSDADQNELNTLLGLGGASPRNGSGQSAVVEAGQVQTFGAPAGGAGVSEVKVACLGATKAVRLKVVVKPSARAQDATVSPTVDCPAGGSGVGKTVYQGKLAEGINVDVTLTNTGEAPVRYGISVLRP